MLNSSNCSHCSEHELSVLVEHVEVGEQSLLVLRGCSSRTSTETHRTAPIPVAISHEKAMLIRRPLTLADRNEGLSLNLPVFLEAYSIS